MHRKTINGEDILFAMTTLGFENYSDVLKVYLAKYRQVCNFNLSAADPPLAPALQLCGRPQ